MWANSYPHIYRVTITPRKAPGQDSKKCRTFILRSGASTDGSLQLINGGRLPSTAPPEQADDLRPIVWYVAGSGTQTFKVIVAAHPTHSFVTLTLKFE